MLKINEGIPGNYKPTFRPILSKLARLADNAGIMTPSVIFIFKKIKFKILFGGIRPNTAFKRM